MLIADRVTQWITPDWPAPDRVRSLVSTRTGKFSQPPWNGFNTALHVGDDAGRVLACRRFFLQKAEAGSEPQWLDQVHGTDVVEARSDARVQTADACFTRAPGQICTLHTADCLPVFFTDQQGEQVALAHAGWRGLAEGIIERSLATFSCPSEQILCWLGPAISQAYFEVGPEVRARFLESQPVPEGAFRLSGRVSEQGDHYFADLCCLARARLNAAGVHNIYGGNLCTYSDSRFFSYRRQHPTGRLLSAIWIQPSY